MLQPAANLLQSLAPGLAGAVQPRKRLRAASGLRGVHARFKTRDGRALRLRLIRTTDAPLLIDLFYSLTPESRRRRFHTAVEHATPEMVLLEAERLANVDNMAVGGALLATEAGPQNARGDAGERIVGVVRLMRNPATPQSPDAEAAIVVRDDYHGQGVGKVLLQGLVRLAQRMHVRTMVADIEADNSAAVRAFRGIGLPTTSDTSHGETRLLISVTE